MTGTKIVTDDKDGEGQLWCDNHKEDGTKFGIEKVTATVSDESHGDKVVSRLDIVCREDMPGNDAVLSLIITQALMWRQQYKTKLPR